METRNVTPHALIAAALVLVIFLGAVAAVKVYPDNHWVELFLSGERITVWLIGWGVLLYGIEALLLRSKWFRESWFTRGLGEKPKDEVEGEEEGR